MRQDTGLTIPTKNQTLLLLAPLLLISLIIAASFWAAHHQPATNLNDQLKVGKEKVKDSDGKRVEIVIPHKSLPPPVVEHDLLYDTPSVAAESLRRHHSGHYRQKLADIWDPHPQYEFTAFGKNFHLQLQLSPSFTVPNLQVTNIWHNMSVREDLTLNPRGCFYTGTVAGDPLSSVAVNLCHGITGHIRTSDASYLIEPAEPYKDHDTPIKHSFTRVTFNRSSKTTSTNSDKELCHVHDNQVHETKIEDVKHRMKRSLSRELTIELMVAVDKKMVEYHGAKVMDYILTLVSIATQLFKDASIGHSIKIALTKYYQLNEQDMERAFDIHRRQSKSLSASDMLQKFCQWQNKFNSENDDSPHHHDTAILLTRENVCRDPTEAQEGNCDTLGLAELGTICDFKSSCSLVRDNGLSAAFTIAHELGHVLNMPHDDDGRCNNFRKNSEVEKNIMSRMVDNETFPWIWSECSRHSLTEFLDAGYGKCLLDPPWTDLQDGKNNELPGESFSDSKQCELVYGPGSKICPYKPACKNLWCTPAENSIRECRTQQMPWADGTFCQEGHWCQKGECVPKDRSALLPVDGDWGPWGDYSKCSRSCGGGVQQAERHCNNPRPDSGGRFCVGRRIKYRACNTQDCPTDQDFRAEQCAKFNNNNLNIPGLSNEVKWVPKTSGIAKEEKCKLYCRVQHSVSYYLLAHKVIDGTVCGPDTFDICVNGLCHEAGCDRKLFSKLQLDYCGKCGGDNSSCELVSGSYDLSQYGYSTVARIPAGSSNLDIRQIGHKHSIKDDNYLVLADENDQFILNGNHLITMFRKIFIYGGTKLEYSGSGHVVERINSSKPLNKDLILKVLSVGNLHSPNIFYQYTIQKDSSKEFSWQLSEEWTNCDKVCNGQTHREAICVRLLDKEKVDIYFCKNHKKIPVSPKKSCNNHCYLDWEVTSRSECSSHCGPGTRSLSFQCVQNIKSPTGKRVPIDNSSCNHLPRPSPTEPCEGLCDEARWVFTSWGPCSKTCGEGIQHRNASCVDEYNRPRDEADCRKSEKKVERVCNLMKCPQWGYGDWTPCSVTCGEGHRRRPYWCHIDNLHVKTDYCNNLPIPYHLTVEACVLDPCPVWITEEWSSCSVSCGEGQMYRTVKCSVPDKCSDENKPEIIQACSMKPCSFRHENALSDFRRFKWRPLPWGACSVTCGEGVRWRDVECYNENTGEVRDAKECRLYMHPLKNFDRCVAPRCPAWKTEQWGPCSATCDEGVETREVYCVSHSGSRLDESSCSPQPRPESERICYSSIRCRSPIWKISPWSQCTVSCGGGYRTRTVTCDSETRHCPHPRPSSQETCNLDPCLKGSWVVSHWSQCSKTCGQGSKFRLVRCKSSSGADLPNEACGGRDVKPQDRTECNVHPCHKPIKYDWQHGRHWSPCSRTCGKGIRQRKVWCAKSSGARVPDSECSASRKPKSVKECQRAECPFDWAPQPWSQCSVTCGRGYKTRSVQCYGYKGLGQGAPTLVDESYCKNLSKPPEMKDCTMMPCDKNNRKTYRWVPGQWGPCSEKCSRSGEQRRKLFCRLGNTKVKRFHCPKNQRPKNKQKCPIDKCESCHQIQRNSNSRKDGEFKLLVHDKVVPIFCHGMDTSSPKEYISLPVPKENYAEVYEKSLRNPDRCPMNGRRLDHCQECITNYKNYVGFNFFKKIRINVTSLVVDGRDWTFAVVFRGGKVPYGEAGDCYSKASCPQGEFRINLEKTGFRVSRDQKWTKEGDYAFHNIQKDQEGVKIIGKCGGYCGRCRPLQGLKLDVLPP